MNAEQQFNAALVALFIAVAVMVNLAMGPIFPETEPEEEPLRFLSDYQPPSVFPPIERVRVIPEPEPVAWNRNDPQVMCMGLNIYHEARGSDLEDQIATGLVVMNRVASSRYPDTPCEVIWQDSQFSWTNDGRSDIPHEQEAYERALMLAYLIIQGVYPDFTHGATHYHTAEIRPYWSDTASGHIRIGSHVYMETR